MPEPEPPEPEPLEPSSGPGWIEYTQNLEEPVDFHLWGYPPEGPEGPSSGQCVDLFSGETPSGDSDPFSGGQGVGSVSGASEPNPFTGNPSSNNPYSEYLSPGPSTITGQSPSEGLFTSSNPPTTQYLNPEWTPVLLRSWGETGGFRAGGYIPPTIVSFSESEAEPIVPQSYTPIEKQVPPIYEKDYSQPQGGKGSPTTVSSDAMDPKTVQPQDEKPPGYAEGSPGAPVLPPTSTYNDPEIGNSDQVPDGSKPEGNVRLCWSTPFALGGKSPLWASHWWIETTTQKKGMGGVNLEEWNWWDPLNFTKWSDQEGQYLGRKDNPDISCTVIRGADEECLNREMTGKTGIFFPPVNYCQTVVEDVLSKCGVARDDRPRATSRGYLWPGDELMNRLHTTMWDIGMEIVDLLEWDTLEREMWRSLLMHSTREAQVHILSQLRNSSPEVYETLRHEFPE